MRYTGFTGVYPFMYISKELHCNIFLVSATVIFEILLVCVAGCGVVASILLLIGLKVVSENFTVINLEIKYQSYNTWSEHFFQCFTHSIILKYCKFFN